MRKLILFNMMTLDGFFAGAHGELDWHVVDEEFQTFAMQQLESVDTLLFGRKTYQMMASYWTTEAAREKDPSIGAKMNETAKIVVSRTLDRAMWGNSKLLKEKVADEVAGMKRQPGRDMIILGSANLAATLTRNSLIDEYRIMLNPVVLGSGKPLFQVVEGSLRLKLLESRAFRSGNVLLTYALAK